MFPFPLQSQVLSPPTMSVIKRTKPSNPSSLLCVILIILSRFDFSTSNRVSPFQNVASYLHETIQLEQDVSKSSIIDSLNVLSRSQSALKKIDGTSHEFYQRSHSKNVNAIVGRAERSAGRIGACADGLFGCELLDFAFSDTRNNSKEKEEGTLSLNGRQIVLETELDEPIPMKIVVIFEPEYSLGSGLDHGGVNGLLTFEPSKSEKKKGRYFVILKDSYNNDLERTLQVLDRTPDFIELNLGLVSGEVACVNGILWRSAANVNKVLKEIILNVTKDEFVDSEAKDSNQSNEESTKTENDKPIDDETKNIEDETSLPAIHFVGRSLAGGVATLSSIMLDGIIPMPPDKKRRRLSSTDHKKRRKRKRSSSKIVTSLKGDDNAVNLHGFGKSRTSAVVFGAPPCISANIKASYITSIIHGDDIICRTTKHSLDRLRERTARTLKGNAITKQVGWMTDTLSLTLSSIKSHAHGSEGEEGRLSIPGKAYLVRPRRIQGGVSSIHEIGGGSLRAAVLWQMNDVLLSGSLWKHHALESYINCLDKVQLRHVNDEDDNDAA